MFKPWLSNVSLRLTLISQFVLCALLPLVILSAFFISSFRSIQTEQQIEKQQAIAQRVMATTQFAFEKVTISLHQLSQDKNMALAAQSALFGYSAANSLEDFVVNHPFIASTVLVDTQFNIVEAAPEETLVLDQDAIKSMFDGQPMPALSEVSATLVYSPALAGALFDQTRSVPVEGALSNNLLVFSVPLFLTETERLDSRSTYMGRLVSFILLEDVLRLVYQRSEGLFLESVSINNVTVTFENIDNGQDVIRTRASAGLSDELSADAVFYLPESSALAPIDALTLQFVLYASAIVLTFLLLGVWFVRFELRPLQRLHERVTAMYRGDLAYKGSNIFFIEFRDVSKLLTEMAKDIADHQQDLEAKVAFRTEALENALSEVKKINRELIRTQNQLVESEKMSQIGVLVAGVAHEVNTPVGVCVTATSILRDRLEAIRKAYESNNLSRNVLVEFFEDAENCVEILTKNTERAADLIHSFKAVSVDQSSEQKRIFNIYEYIDLVLRSLKKELKRKDIHVEVIGDREHEVETYPGAFSQIITNLVMNAIKHAFNDQQESQRSITIEFELTPANELDLTFSDNGKGVPAKSLPNLFEPFYTTSRQSGGSGLGLSIVYNLATQRLGGKINCYCEPGNGLTIFIEFPVTRIEKAVS